LNIPPGESPFMANRGEMNDASRFRYIQRRIKEGMDPERLKRDLGSIKDPYFRSQSLLSMALSKKTPDKGTPENTMIELLDQSFKECSRVKQEWRRAELIVFIMKRSKDLDKDTKKHVDRHILEEMEQLINGPGFSDAIKGTAGYFGSDSWKELIDLCLRNSGSARADVKTVIRKIIDGKQWEMGSGALIDRIGTIEDLELKISLLGSLHLQVRKRRGEKTPPIALEMALNEIGSLNPDEANIQFSTLCRNNLTMGDLDLLEGASRIFTSNVYRVKTLSNLATASDKAGDRKRALHYLDEAEGLTRDIVNKEKMAGSLGLLASGRKRMGQEKEAMELYRKALEIEDLDPGARSRIEKQMDGGRTSARPIETSKGEDLNVKGRNHVLALYDTYEGSLKQTHIRAVARAAPLCVAFYLDLALLGFPTDDVNRMIELASNDTNIGKGGAYLKDLHSKGKVHLVKCTDKDPPKDWKELGLPVATTSNPSKHKKVNMEEARKLAIKDHSLQRVCLIMGIGRKGLPRSLIDSVPYHLEITGVNIALETATAMGILAYLLAEGDKE